MENDTEAQSKQPQPPQLPIRLTLAEFYAFGLVNQRIYFDKDIDFIKADLQGICNTNKLISITEYSATPTEKLTFDGQNDERYTE